MPRTSRKLAKRVELATKKGMAAGLGDDMGEGAREVMRRMQLFIGSFVFIYSWALLNRLTQHFTGTVVPVLGLLHVLFLPLAGFANAVITFVAERCQGDADSGATAADGSRRRPKSGLLPMTQQKIRRRFTTRGVRPPPPRPFRGCYGLSIYSPLVGAFSKFVFQKS